MKKTALFIFALAVLLFPFFALSFFNFPSADDFTYANNELIAGFWHTQLQMYFGWSGRYLSTALLSLSPLTFGSVASYKWFGLINLLLLMGAFFKFLKTIFGGLFSGPYSKIHFVAFFLGFFLVFLGEMPSPVEALYWLSGFVTYTWAFVVFLLALDLYCKHRGWGFQQQPRSQVKAPTQAASLKVGILLSMASIVIAGFNETLAMTWLFVLTLGMGYEFFHSKKVPRALIYPFIWALMCFLFSALAPGNQVRHTQFTNDSTHGSTLPIVALKCFGLSVEIFFRYLRPPFLLGLFLLVPTLYKMKSQISTWLYSPRARLFSFLSLAALTYLFLAPGVWAMGHSPPRRTLNFLCAIHLFSATVFFLQYVWSRPNNGQKLLDLYHRIEIKFLFKRKAIAFLLSLLLFGNVGTAWLDLLTKASTYGQENHERMQIFAKNKKAHVILNPYSKTPETIFFDDITEDNKDWRNVSLAQYFDLKSVKLKSSTSDLPLKTPLEQVDPH